MAVSPRWSQQGPTPASFGTPEAAAAPRTGTRWQTATPDQLPQTSWSTLTGQNLEGTSNAFDTTFWETAAKQDREQSTRGMDQRWTRPDATGVAVYNDEANGIRFGDVFLNGQKQGNLREGYAGVDREQGNEMLARMVLPREVWAKAYETEAGKPLTFAGSVEEELNRAERENTEAYAKGLSAFQFEENVRDRAEGMQDSAGYQAANIGVGAAGGAATGAGLGATIGSVLPGAGTAIGAGVGAIVGGLVGGFGSWLNRDARFTELSQAQEQYRLATADGHQTVGWADAFSGYAGFAAGSMSPTSQLYRGIYDATSEGGVGDSVDAFRNSERGLGATALDTAALLVDGVGSFGSKIARTAFTATMGGSALGESASVVAGTAEGNIAFNPYAGRYEDIGAGGMAQLAASAGIDVAQTAAAQRVGGVINAPFRRARGEVEAVGGHRISTLADGTREARLGFTALIPSEAATGLTARMLARRSLRQQGAEATPDALRRETARYIDNLSTGRRTIATAAVNGFGEGAEEVAQAVLGATAFGETPTFNELFEAARQGFAMGAGMGTAIGVGQTSASARMKERADAIAIRRGQEPLTDEVWTRMSDSERAVAARPSAMEEGLLSAVADGAKREAGAVAAANIPELQRATDVAVQAAAQEASNSQGAVEMSRLQTMSNLDWDPQDYVVSLGAARRDVRARQALMQKVAQSEEVRGPGGTILSATPEERQRAALIAASDADLLRALERTQAQYDAAPTPAAKRAVIRELNQLLRRAWYATGDDGYGPRRSASVLAARYPLNSAGSFQLLRLQIDPRLTAAGNDVTALVSDKTIVPQGGDYDGDRNSNVIRALLPDESYNQLRWGAGQLTSDGTMLAPQPYTEAVVELAYRAKRTPGSAEFLAYQTLKRDLTSTMLAILGRSTIPYDRVKELVADTVRGLTDRRAGAVGQLLSTLATDYAGPMRELAQTLDDSPYLALDRAAERALRSFQTQSALRAPSRPGTRTPIPAVERTMPRYSTTLAPASSEILSAMIAAQAYDVFRVQTVLKYNARREATETQPQERASELAALIQTFTALNDGLVSPGEQAMMEGTAAQEAVQTWLRRLAVEHQQQFGTRTRAESMVLLAGARVADVDRLSGGQRGDGEVTLLQAMLHDVLTDLRRKYAEVINRSDTLAARVAGLEQLTQQNYVDETGGRHAAAGTAFVEVFGATPIGDLLGDQGAAINSYTVRGLRDTLIEMRYDVRREFESGLRAHPSYATAEGENASPYRVLVDAVMESAHQQLTEEKGLPHGALAASSARASENFRSMHDSLRSLMRARGEAPTSAAAVRSFLGQNPGLASRVLAVMEARGVRAGVVQRTTTGELTRVEFPQWIYEVLAEPRSGIAEMMLLRETIDYAYAALGDSGREIDVHRVNDRILRLRLHLDYTARDFGAENMADAQAALVRFNELFYDPTLTVEDFIRALNTDSRFRDERSAPYIAWNRDRSVVEASRYGSGVSEVMEGTEMRDALRDAAAAANAALNLTESTKDFLEHNSEQLSMLREARGNERSVNRAAWENFEAWVDQSRDLHTMVGASVWINQASQINEIVGNMGVKGISPKNVEAMGRAIAAQMPVYDAAVGQLIASSTAGTVADTISDPGVLVRGQRQFVLPDGTVVDWAGITASEALDLLSNERTAGIAARALGMTAWDYNADTGQIMQTAVVGEGIAGLTADPAVSLFGPGTSSKLRRLMVLEAKITTPGGKPVIPVLLAQQMNIREAAMGRVLDPHSPQRERMAIEILEDIADALQALSTIEGLHVRNEAGVYNDLTLVADDPEPPAGRDDLPAGTGEQVSLAHQAILRAARISRRAHGTDNLVSKMLAAEGPLRDVQHELVSLWAAEFSRSAVASGDEIKMALARRISEDLNRADDFTSPLDVMLTTYRNFEDPAVQRLLLSHVAAHGDIARAVPWAEASILRALDPRTPQVTLPYSPSDTITLPDLTSEQWEDIARGVIAFSMHVNYGIGATSDQEISAFPSLSKQDALEAQLPYWDPTFVDPALTIFAPDALRNPTAALGPLLNAQIDLVTQMAPSIARTPQRRAEAAVAKFMAPRRSNPDTGTVEGTTGRWHALMPALMHSATGAVMASAAESAISMAGVNPDAMAMLAATTQQDWTLRPNDDELSVATFAANSLTSAIAVGGVLDTPMSVNLAGYSGPAQRPLAQLEGRVARRVVLRLPDGTEELVLGNARYSSGLLLPASTGVPAGEAGVLTLGTLAPAVQNILRDAGVPQGEWGNATVEVSFFHPDTKAVSATRGAGDAYSHNPWFDGINGQTDAAFVSPSLLGSLFFSLDGTIPQAYDTALGSIKKLTFALQQVTTMPESVRRAITDTGTTDMAAVLRRLTDFVLKQPIDGKPLGAARYNAVYKLLSLLYVVRHVENGVPGVLSAEQVIARQARGEALGEHAQVVGLPLPMVLALMGELGARVPTVTPFGDLGFSIDVSRATEYRTFPAQAWTESMFGGLVAVQRDGAEITGWATRDLLREPALANLSMPKPRAYGTPTSQPGGPRDFYSGYRTHAREVHEGRERLGADRWIEQDQRVRTRVGTAQNISAQVTQAVQLAATGSNAAAAQLMAPVSTSTTTSFDMTTAWEYVHRASRAANAVEGELTSGELEQAAFGDTVFVPADTFLRASQNASDDALFEEARPVLDRLGALGAKIAVPPSELAAGLRARMLAHLNRRADYVSVDDTGFTFEPSPAVARTRAQIAFASTLKGARHTLSQNRVPISLSAHNPVNENAIMSVNGGLGANEDYFVREVAQTARYAGYAPAQNVAMGNDADGARQRVISLLLPVLEKPDGRAYLRRVSELDQLPVETEEDRARLADAEADFVRALDQLRDRLRAAKTDPQVPLMPSAGEEFGTGDLIPLVSYNDVGELVGIHLYRHGHEPVREDVIAGYRYPAGNEALGVGGARLTIDRAEVDPAHTTHRGEIVSGPDWLGLQGFVAKIRVALSDLGSKVFETGTGMKWTTGPEPEAGLPMPSIPVVGSLPVLGAGDLASPTAKTSDQWWWNTPAKIVESVGFDTMPFLVRALTGREYDPANPNEWSEATVTVRNTLRSFAAQAAQGIVEPDQLISRSTTSLQVQLQALMQRQLVEIMGDDAPTWSGDLVGRELADVTMLRLVLSALTTGAQLDEVLGAPGFLNGQARSHTMHPVFTTLLHQLPTGHPARAAFVDQINQRMAAKASQASGWNGVDRWELNDDSSFTWTRFVQRGADVLEIPDMLAFAEIRNTDHNDALSDQALDRKQRGNSSETAIAMLNSAFGAPSLLERPFTAGQVVFGENKYMARGVPGRLELAFNRGAPASPHTTRFDGDLKLSAAEEEHVYTEALPAARAISVTIDTSGWYEGLSREKREAAANSYQRAFDAALRALHLPKSQAVYLHEMIRLVLGRPASSDRSAGEFVTNREAMAALRLITRNAKRGLLPTRGGAVNSLTRNALQALRTGGYPLIRSDGTKRPVAAWSDWVDVVLSETFSSDQQLRGYPAVSNIIDGVLFAYRKDVRGIPTMTNSAQQAERIATTRSGLIVASPVLRRRFDNPVVQAGEVRSLAEMEAGDWIVEDLPQQARAIIEKRMATWEAKSGLRGRRRQSPRAEAIAGAQVREELARTNVVVRFAQLWYMLKTFINPGLFIGAFVELFVRGEQERAVSFLAGESTGRLGRQFTPAQRAQWNATVDALADSPAFYQMVYENTNYQQAGSTTRLEKRLQGMTTAVSAIASDPTWGTRATTIARRFLEAAWDSTSKMPLEQTVPLEQFLDIAANSPAALEELDPTAVAHGYSRVEYARNLQDNLLARMVRRTTERVIGSGGPGTNTVGALLLRFPTLFFRFRSNTLINMLGLQAPHAILTTLLSDRTKKPGGLMDRVTGADAGMDPVATDQARIEDSIDLTRSIIRSGVSHTQLFLAGSIVSAAGFGGGDDDEMRLLNKLRRYQDTPVAQDPLSLENDFRNADSWFSELLPGGMGVPSWTIRMFTSPMMGVARFKETGDFRQVFWGFSDALGSMPLLNIDNVLNGWNMANELAEAAETSGMEDNVEATSNGYKYLVTAVGTLESMMFESAFASMLYQAADEWDRDPYKRPQFEDGEVHREGPFNVPGTTTALDDFVDPITGETRSGYVGRNDIDSALHAMAERQPFLAYGLAMIMRDSTFIRYNMPVKTREVDSAEITQDEAEEILVSLINNETGQEQLTRAGAEGIVRGVHLGSVRLDSPALQGVFIPREMRQQLEKDFLSEFTQKYLDAGYSKTDALNNAKRDYYGQGYGEPEALGLADIVWSNAIPEYGNQQYMQLNTTYVMGPNGRPIATGLQRSVLSSLGILPAEMFHAGQTGNLGADQLLNSVDDVRGINLGMRGLVRVDETWATPTAEEIGEGITKALEEIAAQIDDINDSLGREGYNYGGWRNYGGRGYGRRGSGGYGRSYGGSSYLPDYGGGPQRLNDMTRIMSPYADDLYSLNTSNPIIRRATIRRERFSSTRGRLNQWQ